jgi:hypothetical protein
MKGERESVLMLDQIIEFAKQLSLLDKVRLIKEVAQQIEHGLNAAQPISRKPGLHAGTGVAWMSDDFDEPLSLKGGE